jgi:hypothetical protein
VICLLRRIPAAGIILRIGLTETWHNECAGDRLNYRSSLFPMLNQLRLLRDVSALVLIATTWRLWFAASDFPAVPFFSFLIPVPRVVDSILSGVLVAALLVDALLVVRRCVSGDVLSRSVFIERGCDLLFVVMAIGLILLNQHCLQPWMYHFLILTPLLWRQSSIPVRTVDEPVRDDSGQRSSADLFSRHSILWLTASIYVWSAWSKLDASFLQSHGPKFVGAICDAVGISTRFWSDQTWQVAAAILPMGELFVGVALLFRRTRRFGLLASLVMHLLLMLAVGPWGLNHRAGVLLWNGFFMIQNLVLLRAARNSDATAGLSGSEGIDGACTARQGCSGTERRVTVLVLAGAVLFPALRSVGYCDTWPAWAVYASSPARILVQVNDGAVEQLPKSLKSYVEPRSINDGWSWLRIDLWSLAATGTPIYPEDRFQRGVAMNVAREADLRDCIRIIHEEEADRWTGNRERFEKVGAAELSEFAKRFLLNSAPGKP